MADADRARIHPGLCRPRAVCAAIEAGLASHDRLLDAGRQSLAPVERAVGGEPTPIREHRRPGVGAYAELMTMEGHQVRTRGEGPWTALGPPSPDPGGGGEQRGALTVVEGLHRRDGQLPRDGCRSRSGTEEHVARAIPIPRQPARSTARDLTVDPSRPGLAAVQAAALVDDVAASAIETGQERLRVVQPRGETAGAKAAIREDLGLQH